jgi:hypothetical protein
MNFLYQLRPETTEDNLTRLEYLALIISRVTNPCILSVLVLLLLTYTESTKVLASWVAILLLFLVLMPLIYVYIRTSRSNSGKKRLADPIAFLRQHPKDILILGIITGLPCLVILLFLEAPSLMLRTLAALLACSIVTALFNIFYRASYHLAAVTTLIIMAALTWGQIFLVLLAGIPVVGWAKYQIHEHTLAQLMTGIALSLAASGTTLYLFSRIQL